MKFDIFFSICQTEVDGYMPTEKIMFQNFFDQVRLADELGFGTAWVAETHLSCQIQKQNPGAVIPHFKGEIGLNTDILQLAHLVFAQTKSINIGSAIRNILCNGGPIAHAEAVKMFLSLHDLSPHRERLLELGFASGRFPFSNTPYGIRPRNANEEAMWPLIKGKIFHQASEIFLRFLRGDVFSSRDIKPIIIKREDASQVEIESFWKFDKVGVIPLEAPLESLRLITGSHDPAAQILANEFMPVGTFNLSITPSSEIETTHERMKKYFHKSGGPWKRSYMPRTVLVFVDASGDSAEEQNQRAREQGNKVLSNYWKAIEGTLDPKKIENAVDNALSGSPTQIVQQIRERFHPDDRVMLWFDFNNHDNEAVKKSMSIFMKEVVPQLKNYSGGL
ncbi:MAG: LLM class flavin-dependent oxidoreductase [Pseudomonadota bacterium]|nr:LLM class flavin-dependent oxidoreductase [Pseudomonadota bacterium]